MKLQRCNHLVLFSKAPNRHRTSFLLYNHENFCIQRCYNYLENKQGPLNQNQLIRQPEHGWNWKGKNKTSTYTAIFSWAIQTGQSRRFLDRSWNGAERPVPWGRGSRRDTSSCFQAFSPSTSAFTALFQITGQGAGRGDGFALCIIRISKDWGMEFLHLLLHKLFLKTCQQIPQSANVHKAPLWKDI